MQETTPSSSKKKVLMETWGCQMNVADSEHMLGLLEKDNYETTDSIDEADLVVLNTCHIREKARHKVVSRLGRLKEIKENRPGFKIAVTGCVAQAEGKKLLKQAPSIDVLVGPGKMDELPQLLREQEAEKTQKSSVGFHKNPYTIEKEQSDLKTSKPVLEGKNAVSRYVNIQQGCNNFCTFCVVPFTRGREVSRTPDNIVEEVRNMIASGAKEVTLLGQNVNSYGLDLVDKGDLPTTETGPFVDLLDRTAQLDGLRSLRFTTSNPHDFTKPLADLFAKHENMGRYIHLPVQSGNDEVLERMRRKVTVAEFDQRVAWLRGIDPEMALSTDLIVGFPGETKEQFEDTLALVEKTKFSFVFSFKYSPRPNTAAARFKEKIDEKEKDRRLKELNTLQDEITVAWNQAELGRERSVLVHYESRKEPGIFYGRTPQFRLVRLKSARPLIGEQVMVKIQEANKTALVGELI